jgi:hypothetical protein
MSERVRPALSHAANQREGPWSWGCPRGISVDATPEPNADYPVAEVVKNLGVTPQSPTLMFSPENWYFAK